MELFTNYSDDELRAMLDQYDTNTGAGALAREFAYRLYVASKKIERFGQRECEECGAEV